jgi:antitoxin ParD1/3/4
MITLNISLPTLMQNWVESQINSDYYIDYGDYIRDLIRRNQHKIVYSIPY